MLGTSLYLKIRSFEALFISSCALFPSITISLCDFLEVSREILNISGNFLKALHNNIVCFYYMRLIIIIIYIYVFSRLSFCIMDFIKPTFTLDFS